MRAHYGLTAVAALSLVLPGCSSSTAPPDEEGSTLDILVDFSGDALGVLQPRNDGEFSLRTFSSPVTVVDGGLPTRAIELSSGLVEIRHPTLADSWEGRAFEFSLDLRLRNQSELTDRQTGFAALVSAQSTSAVGCRISDIDLSSIGANTGSTAKLDRTPMSTTRRITLVVDFDANSCRAAVDGVTLAQVNLTEPVEPGLNEASIYVVDGLADNLRVRRIR